LIKYTPVPVSEHESILGKNFKTKFAAEMCAYYAPFQNKKRAIQVAKETWEYAVSDSIPKASWVGAGNYVADVRAPTADLDVKGLSIKSITNKQSSEASVLQNNKQENDGFGKLFESKDYKSLKTMFVDPIDEKIKDTNNLHLLAIVRETSTKKVYYSLLKVTKSNLNNKQFLDRMEVDGKRSISLPMIDPQFGYTYLYIAKRRIEIRLNCEGMKDYLVYSHSY
jgi:hypothetical protein